MTDDNKPPEPNEWLEWAIGCGVDPVQIAFAMYKNVIYRPEDSEEFEQFKDRYESLPSIQEILEG